MSRFVGPLLALTLMLGVPALLGAQQVGGADGPNQQELESMFAEFQQIHMQLEDIQMQALRDPQLSAAQEELGEEIRTAMAAKDPNLPQRMERIEQLETEAMTAQQAGDAQKLQQILGEAHEIEEHFMTVQTEVMTAPAIAAKLTSFQTQLERKMLEVNPQTENLIARFRELESKLSASMNTGA